MTICITHVLQLSAEQNVPFFADVEQRGSTLLFRNLSDTKFPNFCGIICGIIRSTGRGPGGDGELGYYTAKLQSSY